MKMFLFLLIFSPMLLFSSSSKKCLYINSYHEGFTWSDAISEVIHKELKDSCEITTFYMDSKRDKSVDAIQTKALKAKKIIEVLKPDIVLTSDDNAAKYLILPYFKDHKTPFLFCGVNWTAQEYGFPFKNVTGMIEVSPIKALYKHAISLTHGNRAIFIGDNTITDKKDLSFFQKYAKKENIILDATLANDLTTWKDAYLKAQKTHDFIILGHNSAIKDWNDKDVKEFLLKNSNKLVLATYSWMMPYAMIGLIVKAEEQGEWISQAAKAVLNGYPISDISITTNKIWTTYINYKLLEAAKVELPRNLRNKANLYDMESN